MASNMLESITNALQSASAGPSAVPLACVSFGKASLKAQKVEAAIRIVAGVLLVCAGFYLLTTF